MSYHLWAGGGTATEPIGGGLGAGVPAPVSFAANDTDVLTVVRFRARSRSTGKTAAMDLHHFFQFRDGKIARYRGTEDTAQTAAVLRD